MSWTNAEVQLWLIVLVLAAILVIVAMFVMLGH